MCALVTGVQTCALPIYTSIKKPWFVSAKVDTLAILVGGPLISVALLLAIMQGPAFLLGAWLFALFLDIPHVLQTHVDRKSVVSGKSVSVRVDLGGGRIMNKKMNTVTI